MTKDSKLEVQEKEVMHFSESSIPREDIDYTAVNEEMNIHTVYDETKQKDHQKILSLIQAAEDELADLKLRRVIMEADFEKLLSLFNHHVLNEHKISTLAKQILIEYISYELLRPLSVIDLQKGDSFNRWYTKHFQVIHRLDEQNRLIFEFQLNVLNPSMNAAFIPLLAFNLLTKEVEIFDHHMASLIRLWYEDHILSRNQLALFNHDLNQLLLYAKKLGFTVEQSLLDNAYELIVNFTSQRKVSELIIDRIFIKLMSVKEYDFELVDQQAFEILLDHQQKVKFYLDENQFAQITIDSAQQRRSILDFLTSYPFLVPLLIGNE